MTNEEITEEIKNIINGIVESDSVNYCKYSGNNVEIFIEKYVTDNDKEYYCSVEVTKKVFLKINKE
jgi:hypothetical protein